VIEADVVRGHGADRVEIARVEMPDMVAEAIAIGVRQFRLRPILSAAFFSANSGLVLYLIKVHSSLPPIAGLAMRKHRVSADRRRRKQKDSAARKLFLPVSFALPARDRIAAVRVPQNS